MNPIIDAYFDDIEVHLIRSLAVHTYEIIRRETASADGKLRARLNLTNGHLVEFFVYLAEANGHIASPKYSFHWQDEAHQLVCRWDNVPHYPTLPHAPHHLHHADGSITGVNPPPDFFSIIQGIEAAIL